MPLRREGLRLGLSRPPVAVALGVAYFLAARREPRAARRACRRRCLLAGRGDCGRCGNSAFGPAARLPVIVGTMAATIAANLLGDRNIWSSIVFAASDTGEAMLVAGLIGRFFGSPFSLDGLRNVLGLFAHIDHRTCRLPGSAVR